MIIPICKQEPEEIFKCLYHSFPFEKGFLSEFSKQQAPEIVVFLSSTVLKLQMCMASLSFLNIYVFGKQTSTTNSGLVSAA